MHEGVNLLSPEPSHKGRRWPITSALNLALLLLWQSMNVHCRRENEAAEQLKTLISAHPLKSHCALLDFCSLGANLGQKIRCFPPANTFFFCGIAVTFSVSTALPAGDTQVSCGETLFTQTCKTRLPARIWALFSLQDLWFIVRLGTHARHTSPEPHSAEPWRMKYTSWATCGRRSWLFLPI